jgi:hypothetical protein
MRRLSQSAARVLSKAAAVSLDTPIRYAWRMHRSLGRVALVTALLSAGCAKHIPLAEPAAPLTPPTHLCAAAEAPPHCRKAFDVERLLGDEAELLGMADTPSGMQGAKILTLRAHGSVLRVKWRPLSSGNLLNEPRKELAAYAVQKLFLDESELVVPPTVAHCFPLAPYRRFAPKETASFKGIDCVLGFASYWLEGVETVHAAREDDWLDDGDGIFDPELFERDPLYRRSVANSNLLTYLINHGDAHDEQFLLEKSARGLRAYVVDNSIAFRSIKNPMLLFRQDWSHIQVSALTPSALDRLAKLTDDDYARLGTVAELERSGEQLVRVSSDEPPSASDGSTMSWHGPRLRIGLTAGEIALVRSRAGDLLKSR